MIEHVAVDAHAGRALAIGFESPLFIPAAQKQSELSCGRDGDGDRSCFAPAGGYVALLGLHELLYVLARLPPSLRFTLDWGTWRESRGAVLLWEAFVSGDAHTKSGDHCQDAATGVAAFLHSLDWGFQDRVMVPKGRGTFSLAGAALLWAGRAHQPWREEEQWLLHASTLVIKPAQRFEGTTSKAATLATMTSDAAPVAQKPSSRGPTGNMPPGTSVR
jgi:hypothetical protein